MGDSAVATDFFKLVDRISSTSPAYDIYPQGRTGNEATQAMLISGNNHFSNIATCLETAHNLLLSKDGAMAIFEHQKEIIEQNWK